MLKFAKKPFSEGLGKETLKRIVTSDEKWAYFRNPNTLIQWPNPGHHPMPVVKHGPFEHNVMFSILKV